MHVRFYTRTQCPLCEEAFILLKDLQKEYQFQLEEIDIYTDDELLEKYQLMIPVVELNGEIIDYGTIISDTVRFALDEALGSDS